MRIINKSRGTGKTTQLIYASAITGFRIIAPNHAMASYIEKMAKDMGLNIPQPMSDVEYRNRKELWNDHTPILIDEVQNQILDEALELYFGAPVVAATMTIPIDDDCVPPTPKPLVFDHKTEKIRPLGKVEMVEEIDGGIRFKVRPITNRDVLNKTFGHLQFRLNNQYTHLKDRLTIRTEDDEDFKFADWLDCVYEEPKKKKEEKDDKDN